MSYDNSDYECNSTITLPIEYESKEKAEYDLLMLWENYIKECENYNYLNAEVKFAGRAIYLDDFSYRIESTATHKAKIGYSGPEFYTVDEWFDSYK